MANEKDPLMKMREEDKKFTGERTAEAAYEKKVAAFPPDNRWWKQRKQKPEFLMERQQRNLQKAEFSPEQVGEELYAKLSVDPNYGAACLFCKNSALLFAQKIEYEMPEEGEFNRLILSYGNVMWSWYFDDIILIAEYDVLEPVHSRRFSVTVPFTDGTDRVMSAIVQREQARNNRFFAKP